MRLTARGVREVSRRETRAPAGGARPTARPLGQRAGGARPPASLRPPAARGGRGAPRAPAGGRAATGFGHRARGAGRGQRRSSGFRLHCGLPGLTRRGGAAAASPSPSAQPGEEEGARRGGDAEHGGDVPLLRVDADHGGDVPLPQLLRVDADHGGDGGLCSRWKGEEDRGLCLVVTVKIGKGRGSRRGRRFP